MRRVSWIAAVGGAALVAAGAAVAHGGAAKSVTPVAATFAATQVTSTKTTTCTNADGTWTRVDATYTGAASGATDLTGPARIDVHAVVNSTKDLGVVGGSIRIDTPGPDTRAHFSAVYAGGRLSGFATGRAHGPSMSLLANLSASFSPAGGFTNGRIGGATEGGGAVEVAAGDCRRQPAQKAVLRITGQVVSVSPSALVVRSGNDQVSCTVDGKRAKAVAKLQAGQTVRATCRLADGSYQLLDVGRRHG